MDFGPALDELRSLIDEGAGENAAALRKARVILVQLRSDYRDRTLYVAEQVAALDADLMVWFSVFGWNKKGRTRESSRAALEQGLIKLEWALKIATGAN